MPRLTSAVPKYSLHRASGQAVVKVDGQTIYLGRYGSRASQLEYDRFIGEWLAAGRRLPAPVARLTIDELLAAYWSFAESYYRKHGEPTHELDNIRLALRPLHELYGESPADELTGPSLKALQRGLIEKGLSRGVINQRIGIIKRVYRWAASENLAPVTTYQALSTVSGLRKGRSAAREPEPVQPVSEVHLNATLNHLPPVIRDMVLLQRYTGCRSGEILGMRPIDVDVSGEIWVYSPERHKTEHHGRSRQVLIGPRGQAVLRAYLERDPSTPCFSPAEAVAERKRRLRVLRKTKVQPSQRDRSKARPRLKAGLKYGRWSYRNAIWRACDNAGVPRWAPNQLRHAAATEIRARYGLEAAQLVLGHSRADVTQIYAERDMRRALTIVAESG